VTHISMAHLLGRLLSGQRAERGGTLVVLVALLGPALGRQSPPGATVELVNHHMTAVAAAAARLVRLVQAKTAAMVLVPLVAGQAAVVAQTEGLQPLAAQVEA
jgi:hypothetical protein